MQIICSLKRGVIDPPEFVDTPDAVTAMLERDPPLTIEEWWREDGRRLGYIRRKPAERVA